MFQLNWHKFLFVVSILSIINLPENNAFAATCGKLTSFKGDVKVLRSKKSSNTRLAIKAKRRMKLECDDIIVTSRASRAKLRMDKAILTIGPNTHLEIAKKTKGSNTQNLNMSFGKVRTLFQGKNDENQTSRFNVKTPAAVAGVRGTDFYVSYKPNEKVTEQVTLTGTVEVIQKETGKKVLVKHDQQVKIENIKAKIEEEVREEKVKLEAAKQEELRKIEELKISEAEKQKAIAEAEEKARLAKEAQRKEIEAQIKQAAAPILVAQIDKQVVEEIKQTSVLVKEDKEFTSPKAVKVLGTPEEWIPAENEELPEKYKDYKNEF